MNVSSVVKVAAAAGQPVECEATLVKRAHACAAIAGFNAESVDCEARFPAEAFEAIRAQRLLGVMIPKELGGDGASMSEVADICYQLGRACASTGMIYAMHQTKLACLVRHGMNSDWIRHVLKEVCDKQLLLASSTTEGQRGGNIRSSDAAVQRNGEAITLERAATVISYGLEADGLVTTARRSEDSINSDQVLVVFLKQDYVLDKILGWNTMGMRGTCSSGFMLKASGRAEQVLPEPYERIHSRTMMPTAHLLWASVWAGVSAAAVERARLFLRKAARQSDGVMPPGAAHFTQAAASQKSLRATLNSVLRRYERHHVDDAALTSIEFQTSLNMLKVDASERAVAITLEALRACGLSGYRNDGEFSISRYLRDALSSPIMINNDRILANVATASLLEETPDTLLD
jgi:acyl-CoA dehydrogenase